MNMKQYMIKKKKKPPSFIFSVVVALLIALSIRSFLFQPFSIPSSSMYPTLLVGDYLFVAKYSYGYSRHSLPFSPPIFSGRVLENKPQRGEVVVFKLPTDGRTDYIKRVIGLEGDIVQIKQGVLYINGSAVQRTKETPFLYRDEDTGEEKSVVRYTETLPNGVSYKVLDMEPNGIQDNTSRFIVPRNHYFVMGDNRDNSVDSRYLDEVGFVPFENLVGKAKMLFFSYDKTMVWKKNEQAIRWTRISKSIR